MTKHYKGWKLIRWVVVERPGFIYFKIRLLKRDRYQGKVLNASNLSVAYTPR